MQTRSMKPELLALMGEMEGEISGMHYDNVAPCYFKDCTDA